MKSVFLSGLRTAFGGLGLTLRHLRRAGRGQRRGQNVRQPGYFNSAGGQGIVTLSYPHERLPVPELGRYQLDCEIDDCIVCDKCARVCPVDCIDIVAIKSPEVIGHTSDGTPKRLYAAKFDIDMAKCCYCGLCTTVCPTECLTMQPEYDHVVTDITKLTYAFATLTPTEAAQREQEWQAVKAVKKDAGSQVLDVSKAKPEVGDSKPAISEATQAEPSKPKAPFKPFGNKPK